MEQGLPLSYISDETKLSVTQMEKLVIKRLGQTRYDEACTAQLDAAIDSDLRELSSCTEKDDAVRVQAIKTRLDVHWKRAVATTSKYRKAGETSGGPQFTINFTGMGGATLRSPTTYTP